MKTEIPSRPDRATLYSLRNKLRKLFNESAKAWERGNASGNSAIAALCNDEERTLARKAEAIIKDKCPGVAVDYPGLYPAFKVNGYDEYTIEGMLCSHFNLPRNYFKQR